MKKLLLFCYLLPIFHFSNAQINSELSTQLQAVLDNSVTYHNNNGVSASLILPDGQMWNGTAGVGKQNIPISDSTLFHGASTTKLNIAILMMLLAEENLVDLEASWTTYVSLDAGFDPSITVRQLLNHSSGIADYLETATSGTEVTADFDFFFNPTYILEEIVNDTPLFTAGSSFQYSNSNYVLAALIAEAVTGNPVHIELRDRIWEPLDLRHTYFGAYENYTEPLAGVWWNFGNGVSNYSDMPTTSMLSYAYGAGNIVSCPSDLALLLNKLFSGQILPSASLNEMLEFVPNSYNTWTAGYGLGLHHISGEVDDTVLGHDGYYTNLSDMFYSMNYGFTLVTMTNTQTEWQGIFKSMYAVIKNFYLNTSTTENPPMIDLVIAPNPSQNQFTVKSSEIIESVEIRTSTGQLVDRIDQKTREISLELKKAGLYFLHIQSQRGSVNRKIYICQ